MRKAAVALRLSPPAASPLPGMERDSGRATAAFHGCRSAAGPIGGRRMTGPRPRRAHLHGIRHARYRGESTRRGAKCRSHPESIHTQCSRVFVALRPRRRPRRSRRSCRRKLCRRPTSTSSRLPLPPAQRPPRSPRSRGVPLYRTASCPQRVGSKRCGQRRTTAQRGRRAHGGGLTCRVLAPVPRISRCGGRRHAQPSGRWRDGRASRARPEIVSAGQQTG